MSTPMDPEDWWETEIIDMSPGVIRYRGYPIEQLIGHIGFAEMVWLMLRGALPDKAEAELLETALMSAVDHGPQAPSIAIARMATTCGVGLNSAMASGLNALGDVHGGAGEQAVQLIYQITDRTNEGASIESAVSSTLAAFHETSGKYVPGFGHRFHPVDPRAPRLMEIVSNAIAAGTVNGRSKAIADEIGRQIEQAKGRHIPMNIDGATAVIYAELGFEPGLARGLFCLSRSVGLLAHAWEQTQQGGRNKGPIPRDRTWTYSGPPPRDVPGKTE